MKEFLYDWCGLNLWLFHAINDLRGDLIDWIMQAGTFLGGHDLFAVYLSLLACFILWQASRQSTQTGHALTIDVQRWLTALTVFSLAYTAEGLLIPMLKHSLDFPRPPLALPAELLHVIGKPELHHSLPSGHANFAMTIAASLWPLLHRRGRLGLVIFVVWVGLSRVNLGAHFPADVIAGYLLGWVVVWLIHKLLHRLLRYKTPPADATRP